MSTSKKNIIRTKPKTASKASKILRSSNFGADSKSVAGSALSNRRKRT